MQSIESWSTKSTLVNRVDRVDLVYENNKVDEIYLGQ